MVDMTVVELSRWQFALTAMYHFLFVPLTLGLSIILAIMESVYVMTGRQVWRDMTKFWGTLLLGAWTGLAGAWRRVSFFTTFFSRRRVFCSICQLSRRS